MRHRRGVTLIELLVVIAIITALSTLIVAVAPRFGERQRATRGASQLQSWLNLAKQRALRDQRPVGIRLQHQDITTNPTPNYIREVQFVEVPDEYIGGTVTVPFDISVTPNPYKFIRLTTPVLFSTKPDNLSALIQVGDVIMIPGPGYAPRRVVGVTFPGAPVNSSNPPYTYRIELDLPLNPTQSSTTAHRVYRKPRAIIGETVLQLPKDIAIDITQDKPSNPTWYRLFPPANTGGSDPFDILFAPSGQVMGFAGVPRISLWVRDVSLGDPGPNQLPPGENTLITINTRSGNVASHPIDPSGLVPNTPTVTTNWNPFRFTQDGLSSGQ